MPATPHVCIIGATVWGNRGAEAMVTTCIGHLRQRFPQIHVSIFSYLPHRDRELVKDENITIVDARPIALCLMFPFAVACWIAAKIGIRIADALLPGPLRQLRRSDAMLDVFGISFADGRELFLPFNLLSLLPAFLLDVPVIKLSQAIGPFRNRLNRIAARFTLRRCTKVFARGEETAAHLRLLDLPADTWAPASDLAFIYEPSYSLCSERPERLAAFKEKLQQLKARGAGMVAICPSSVVYNKAVKRQIDYIGSLADMVKRIVQGDRQVLVIPHATREGLNTLRNNDLPVIELLRRRCAADLPEAQMQRILWTDFDVSSAGIRNLLQSTDLVITSRFHAMVAALALGIPPLVLGWSHKYREVLKDFALQDCCFDIDHPDMDAFAARLAIMTRPDFQDAQRHKERLAAVQAATTTQLDYVALLLQQSPRRSQVTSPNRKARAAH